MMKLAYAEEERMWMKKIRVYRHADCAKCARFAKVALYFDWLDRIEASTGTPTTGPLRLGEVVVEDLTSGRITRGAEGIELIFRNIPAYTPFLLLLKVPPVRHYVEKEVSGCEDNSCKVASKPPMSYRSRTAEDLPVEK
jgi:hypothetical protein